MSVPLYLNVPNNYPADWMIDRKPVPARQNYMFWIFLQHSEEALLRDFLDVADVASPHYAAYRTYKELQKYTLDPTVVSTIRADVKQGMRGATVRLLWTGDILEVVAPIGAIEKYFRTQLSYWRAPTLSDQQILRMQDPHAPIYVSHPFAQLVEMVTPLNFFPSAELLRSDTLSTATSQQTVQPIALTPQMIRDTYYGTFEQRYGTAAPALEESQKLGVRQAFYTDAPEGGFSQQDTALFVQDAFGNEESIGALESAGISEQDQPNSEANLDVAMLLLVGKNIPTTQIMASGSELLRDAASLPDDGSVMHTHIKAQRRVEGFFKEIFAVAAKHPDKTIYDLDLPQVISCSYGYQMNFLDPFMLKRVNREMMKLGLMGITVVIAAGDTGSTINGYMYGNKDLMSMPSILSVGYTYLDKTFNGTPELVKPHLVNDQTGYGGSAFGLSELFHRKRYMPFAEGVVDRYVKHSEVQSAIERINRLQKGDFFPQEGRAYPDVVALGCYTNIYVQGQQTPVGGASMAAPVAAGVISTINYWRRKYDQPFVGYMHPTLYLHHEAMIHVRGNNRYGPQGIGFPCVEGLPYDAAGLGDLNFYNLAQILVGELK